MTGFADWIAKNLPILMAQFGVAILLTYYLLVDGAGSVEKFLELLPGATVRLFLSELNAIYNSLFNVYLINSLLTGLITISSTSASASPYPFLWGIGHRRLRPDAPHRDERRLRPHGPLLSIFQDYLRVAALLILGTIFLNVFPENIMRPGPCEGGGIDPSGNYPPRLCCSDIRHRCHGGDRGARPLRLRPSLPDTPFESWRRRRVWRRLPEVPDTIRRGRRGAPSPRAEGERFGFAGVGGRSEGISCVEAWRSLPVRRGLPGETIFATFKAFGIE